MNITVVIGGIAMILLWGVWGIVVKLATQQIGMQALIWGQLTAAGLIPLYFFLFRDVLPLDLKGGGVALAMVGGALGVLGTIVFYVLLRVASASVVVPLSSLYPVVTIVLGYLILHEDLSLTRVAGVACALAAIRLLSA
ncbi:MAG: DMT family transporter [Chloroflexota bacterium]|nr:DMT family transporter [Chloroflexota bacterium]